MSVNGETAPRLGEEFRSRASTLLKALGYIERINRRFGIDFGSDPPSKRKNLIRPLFSPDGRTAFDFKSGVQVRILTEAGRLREKIDALNSNGNPEFSNIEGGVIITDNKLSNTHIRSSLDDRQIYCWDIRYAHFLAKKVGVLKTFLRDEKKPREKQLDDWTTLLVNFGSYNDFLELAADVFYHYPLEEMNNEKVNALLQRFASYVRRQCADLNIKIIIHLRLHSIAEVTEGAIDKFRELTSPAIRLGDEIQYESNKCFIASYNSAPWFIYCQEER
jgi:hypothetical protein